VPKSRSFVCAGLIAHAGLLALLLQAREVLADEAQPPQKPQKVSFYFAAHEDDWQLFMNPTAFRDVADPKTKVVFIHTTAGDAGLGTGNGGRKRPYYLARENGAKAAIRFMADGNDFPVEPAESHITFLGHPVFRVRYRNTVAYFLRAPDGNPDGTGYDGTGHQSLLRLSTGENPVLAAVDGSTSYHGWKDFVSTLRAIIDDERGDAPLVQLDVAEQDAKTNPEDHADHQATAHAALDAAQGLACARRLHFIDYASANLPENLDPKDRDLTSAVFAVTAAGIRDFDHLSYWHHYDQAYVGRDYYRVEMGQGPCKPQSESLQAVAGRLNGKIGKTHER
jgi:hypothetical protein